jgi:hypothetical protein
MAQPFRAPAVGVGAPEVIPPAPPAVPPAAQGGPRRIVTYRELLTDEANSPAPARLANYLQGYRFDGRGEYQRRLRSATSLSH